MSQTRFALRNFKGNPVKFFRVEQEVLDTGRPQAAAAPTHHIFVFDVSGSMYYDLKDLKSTVEKVLTLDEFNNPSLKVSLITYSSMGDVRTHFERVPIDQVMRADSPQIKEIRGLNVRGLTCISQGLVKAETLIEDGEVTCISLHSDGYANDRSPSRENTAIQAAVDELKKHPGVFVNTVAYRDWADFSLLAGIANQLSGVCIQARTIKQVYQAFYDTQQLLTGSMSPTLEVGAGQADYVLFLSKSAKKVLGCRDALNVRGLAEGDDAVAFRLYEVDQATYEGISAEAPVEVALAFARASIAEGNLNYAKYALVASRVDALLRAHYKALTTSAVAAMAESVENEVFSGSPQVCTGGADGLSFEGPDVLSVLRTLGEFASHIRIDMPSFLGAYKRRGIKRASGTRNENGELIPPKYKTTKRGEDGLVQLQGVDINRNTATANLLVVQDVDLVVAETGEVVTKVAGIPLQLKDFRNYTVVGDGEVTTPKIPIQTSDKRAFKALRDLGALSGDFDPQKIYTIELGSMPLVDFDQSFDLPADTFTKLAKLTVLGKILAGTLKSSSASLTGEQIEALKEYHLTPSLYFSPPTTTPYVSLEAALAKGEVDTRLSYKVDLGMPEITSLSKLKSGNAYLQRRFTLEGEAKPTLDMCLRADAAWKVKALSARTKLDDVDALSFPIYEEFLGLADTGQIRGLAELAGLDYDERESFLQAVRGETQDAEERVEILKEAQRQVDAAIEKVYSENVIPLAFYVGATGLVPENLGSQARTAEQIAQLFPDIKLSKDEKEEGVFFPLSNGLLLTVYVKGEYFSVSRPAA